jgi:hypothetical protein
MASKYRVATQQQSVGVCFGPGQFVSGELFLHSGTSAHAGPESVEDLLNDPAPFFPLRVSDAQPGTLLISKAHVRFVTTPRDEGARGDDSALISIGVEVRFDETETVRGILRFEQRPGRQRLLDVVNDGLRTFFSLSQTDQHVIVNRAHVQSVSDVTDVFDLKLPK